MSEELKKDCCENSCCKIEAVMSIDDRGQMILPKDVREKANIKAGDKLVLITWEKNGEFSCISLMKTEMLSKYVKDIFDPMMRL